MVRLSCIPITGVFLMGWILGCLFVVTFLRNDTDDDGSNYSSKSGILRTKFSSGDGKRSMPTLLPTLLTFFLSFFLSSIATPIYQCVLSSQFQKYLLWNGSLVRVEIGPQADRSLTYLLCDAGLLYSVLYSSPNLKYCR